METTAKERVEIELKELEEKIDKLRSFIFSPDKFLKLPKQQQIYLQLQYHAMKQYSLILYYRLDIWDKE